MKTLYFDNKTHSLCAIDQTKLPQKLQYIYISDVTTLYDAIKTLKIRGAPAIGVGAALGLYACALRFDFIFFRYIKYYYFILVNNK